MVGWAMQTGALDLTTCQVTPDTRTSRQKEALQQVLDNGNNGWVAGPGASYALRDVPEGELDRRGPRTRSTPPKKPPCATSSSAACPPPSAPPGQL
jgi:hypothetical protein